MAKKRLSDEDLALWQHVAAQAAPLKRARKKPAPRAKKSEPAPEPPSKPKPETAKPSTKTPAAPAARLPSSPAPAQAPDRRTATRLKRGQIAIDAKLDLHGMTQSEAHEELRRFVAGSREAGRRCVLVVTGVGARGYGMEGGEGRGTGILRRSVPRWLAEPHLREAVLSFAPADQRHGGQGALYVLLRKKR